LMKNFASSDQGKARIGKKPSLKIQRQHCSIRLYPRESYETRGVVPISSLGCDLNEGAKLQILIGGELDSTGLLEARVACRSWSEGYVKI